MGWLAVALVALAILAGAWFGVRRRRGRIEAVAARDVPSADPTQPKRPATALSELRDMREALGPATHNRVERRRTPQPGTAPKIERRKKGGRRGPAQE